MLIILTYLVVHNLNAQLYTLNLHSPENKTITHWLREQPKLQDSIQWMFAQNDLIQRLHQDGYLLAEIEVWNFENDTLHAIVSPGNIIHWANITFKALEFLPPHWVNELNVSGDVVDFSSWKENVTQVLKAAQSEGYLFASYQLNVKSLLSDSLYAEIIFEPGYQIKLDTIEIEGTARLSEHYLEKTLGIQKGEPLTQEAIILLHNELNNLRFVQQYAPPVLILFQDKATIRTYLNNRNASSFDVLAGVQPSTSPERNLTITGYAELDLINQLTRGERMYIHLEKLRARSQEVELAAAYPYLLELPFGIEGEFRLQKNDTLYSEIEWKAGISLPLGRDQYVSYKYYINR
jgi:hypothetical protein